MSVGNLQHDYWTLAHRYARNTPENDAYMKCHSWLNTPDVARDLAKKTINNLKKTLELYWEDYRKLGLRVAQSGMRSDQLQIGIYTDFLERIKEIEK